MLILGWMDMVHVVFLHVYLFIYSFMYYCFLHIHLSYHIFYINSDYYIELHSFFFKYYIYLELKPSWWRIGFTLLKTQKKPRKIHHFFHRKFSIDSIRGPHFPATAMLDVFSECIHNSHQFQPSNKAGLKFCTYCRMVCLKAPRPFCLIRGDWPKGVRCVKHQEYHDFLEL